MPYMIQYLRQLNKTVNAIDERTQPAEEDASQVLVLVVVVVVILVVAVVVSTPCTSRVLTSDLPTCLCVCRTRWGAGTRSPP